MSISGWHWFFTHCGSCHDPRMDIYDACAGCRYLLPDAAGWEQDEVYKRPNEEAMEVGNGDEADVLCTCDPLIIIIGAHKPKKIDG